MPECLFLLDISYLGCINMLNPSVRLIKMNKQEIIAAFARNHHSFIDYINSLSVQDIEFCHGQKWSAGQQLEHIVICVKPFVKALGMDKKILEQTFGVATKQGRTYDELLTDYVTKLQGGGKAPERFVPQPTSFAQRDGLTETLTKLIEDLNSTIANYTETDLDTLCLPHPLLGTISIREMLFNAIYHVEHHHQLAKQNLLHT